MENQDQVTEEDRLHMEEVFEISEGTWDAPVEAVVWNVKLREKLKPSYGVRNRAGNGAALQNPAARTENGGYIGVHLIREIQSLKWHAQ